MSSCTCPGKCLVLESKGAVTPTGCPGLEKPAVMANALEEYRREGSFARRVWQAFARLVGTGGAQRSRLEHILEFSASMGYTRLGIASCARYLPEVLFLKKSIEDLGFECTAVTCKVGNLRFADFDLPVTSDWTLCNPLAQAMLLNEFGSDLNIMLGLCMGHDLIFAHYSKAPTTTLTVKEKISEDNPLSTLRDMLRGERGIHPHMPTRGALHERK